MDQDILIISDLHSGHGVGLTHPDWQRSAKQAEQWDTYNSMLKAVGHVDILVVNGDAIDGKGERSGGTEQIVTDRHEQIEMAAAAIREVNADKILMTYGTPYHVGTEEDFETPLARMLGAEIRDMLEFTVCGINFNVKHKIGASSIPHGRTTPIARERLWNLLWDEMGVQQKAHILIRSHVHYFAYAGGSNWFGIITPALQGLGSKYGSRQCSTTVDFGMVHFTVRKGGTYSWRPLMAVLTGQVRPPLSL